MKTAFLTHVDYKISIINKMTDEKTVLMKESNKDSSTIIFSVRDDWKHGELIDEISTEYQYMVSVFNAGECESFFIAADMGRKIQLYKNANEYFIEYIFYECDYTTDDIEDLPE